MITVTVERDATGLVRCFEARGHARFAVQGQDVVCAGVSALLQTAVQGLQERLGLAVEYTSGKAGLRCSLESVELGSPEALIGTRVLLDAIVMGVASIARDYPGHVQLHQRGQGQERAVPPRARKRRSI